MSRILVKLDVCFECGSDKNIHQHHIVPQVLGGTKMIPLCGVCHGKVHGKNFGLEWKRLQMEGIQKAREKGVYKGRKPGTYISPEEFLEKPKSKAISEDLDNGYTQREISERLNCSFSTISKVRKAKESLGFSFKPEPNQLELGKHR